MPGMAQLVHPFEEPVLRADREFCWVIVRVLGAIRDAWNDLRLGSRRSGGAERIGGVGLQASAHQKAAWAI